MDKNIFEVDKIRAAFYRKRLILFHDRELPYEIVIVYEKFSGWGRTLDATTEYCKSMATIEECNTYIDEIKQKQDLLIKIRLDFTAERIAILKKKEKDVEIKST